MDPITARAQQAERIYTIGWLNAGAPQHIGVPVLKLLRNVAAVSSNQSSSARLRGGARAHPRKARPEKASRGGARARNHLEGRCLEHVHSAKLREQL
jgi:hypothetical protein